MKLNWLILILIFGCLLQTCAAAEISDFEQFDFTEIFDRYFNDGLSGWSVLEMANDLYMTTMGSFVFWSLMFIAVYAALHIATGGTFIPSAVFSTTGFILISVMPSELSGWAYIGISLGLFALPVYKYFKN